MIFVLHLYYFLSAQQPGDLVINEPIIVGEEDPVNEPINNEPIIINKPTIIDDETIVLEEDPVNNGPVIVNEPINDEPIIINEPIIKESINNHIILDHNKGNGIGSGRTKNRHRTIHSNNNIQGITKPAIRRLAR